MRSHIKLLDQHVSTQMQQALCQYMDVKSTRHCQKMVYVVEARARCSWRYKVSKLHLPKGQHFALLSSSTVYGISNL